MSDELFCCSDDKNSFLLIKEGCQTGLTSCSFKAQHPNSASTWYPANHLVRCLICSVKKETFPDNCPLWRVDASAWLSLPFFCECCLVSTSLQGIVNKNQAALLQCLGKSCYVRTSLIQKSWTVDAAGEESWVGAISPVSSFDSTCYLACAHVLFLCDSKEKKEYFGLV